MDDKSLPLTLSVVLPGKTSAEAVSEVRRHLFVLQCRS